MNQSRRCTHLSYLAPVVSIVERFSNTRSVLIAQPSSHQSAYYRIWRLLQRSPCQTAAASDCGTHAAGFSGSPLLQCHVIPAVAFGCVLSTEVHACTAARVRSNRNLPQRRGMPTRGLARNGREFQALQAHPFEPISTVDRAQTELLGSQATRTRARDRLRRRCARPNHPHVLAGGSAWGTCTLLCSRRAGTFPCSRNGQRHWPGVGLHGVLLQRLPREADDFVLGICAMTVFGLQSEAGERGERLHVSLER